MSDTISNTNETNNKLKTLPVRKFSEEEANRVPIFKDCQEYITTLNFKNEEYKFNCNTYDTYNLNLIWSKKNSTKTGITIYKPGNIDENVLKSDEECSICLEKIKFVDYKNKTNNSKIKNKSINKNKFKKQVKRSIQDGFLTECGHKFHIKCLSQSLIKHNVNCPYCRNNLFYNT
jgi:hypothetical protein